VGVTRPSFGILGPPNISRTVEARNFKFVTDMHDSEYLRKNAKLGQKGSCGGHVTHFGILRPANISGRSKLEILYLAKRWMAVSTYEKNAKLGQNLSGAFHMTHFWNFVTPLIYPGGLKIETSNLAQR